MSDMEIFWLVLAALIAGFVLGISYLPMIGKDKEEK